MSIEVQDLTKMYGQQRAVDGISFCAKEGEIVGFLGPNGAGKSTTMKIATGYIPPTSGTVMVSGFDVCVDPLSVQKNIGYLPEHNPLYLDMYVHEYLRFIASLHGIKGAFANKRVVEMIDMCGLGIEQNKKIGALSKGYRQRVGLAQALVHDPKVLILDEPTTGLDPNQILEIRNLLTSISHNKTVLLSTHIMQEVQALCHSVVIINRGKIVANDSVDQLKKYFEKRQRITITLANTIDVGVLKLIEGVGTVEQIDLSKYIVETMEHGIDLRPTIFDLSKTHGWNLLELSSEEISLEDVFRQLTKVD